MSNPGFAFVIILPNEKRDNVEAANTKTIREVLEDVCRKHQLNPTQYNFTHHNKILDVGNSLRSSGLPNNATLHLVKKDNKGEIHIIGDHEALLYHGEDVSNDWRDGQDGDDEDSDDFFELSEKEVKRQYMELQKKREQLENAPLTTRSTKELERDTQMLRTLHDYPLTVVRIRFPADRYILQGVFRTGDKLGSVHTWLTSLLANPSLNFYLFTAPPKKVLEREVTLVEQQLVRMAVLYFGSGNGQVPEASDKVLKPELYSQISSPEAVVDFVHKKLKKVVVNQGEGQGQGQAMDVDTTAKASTTRDRSRTPPPQRQPPPRTEGTVPKWFKMK